MVNDREEEGENNLSASYSASAVRAASPTCGGRTHLAQLGALAGVRSSPAVSPVRRYIAPGSGTRQSFDLGGKLEGGYSSGPSGNLDAAGNSWKGGQRPRKSEPLSRCSR